MVSEDGTELWVVRDDVTQKERKTKRGECGLWFHVTTSPPATRPYSLRRRGTEAS